MTFDPNDVLQRFHRVLVREIQASNPEYLNAPFSVAEIYQNLVPYRTHRDEIGVDMNADYEHALLRLLAGENDYLTIESRTARREIREELESPNPNTGLYRDFAAADVRLNSDVIDEALMWGPGKDEAASAEEPFNDEFTTQEPGMGPAEESEEENVTPAAQDERPIEGFSEEEDSGAEEEGMEEEIVQESEGEEEAFREEEGEVVADEGGEVDSEEVPFEISEQEVPWPPMVDLGGGEEVGTQAPESEDVGAAPSETCAWCRETLPQRPGVNFCPFCGSSVHLVPCPECGEELKLTWRFCIACGMEVSS